MIRGPVVIFGWPQRVDLDQRFDIDGEELLERKRNLTDRFAHLDSLAKLAQRTVIEAEKEAETIKKEAEMAATSKSARGSISGGRSPGTLCLVF